MDREKGMESLPTHLFHLFQLALKCAHLDALVDIEMHLDALRKIQLIIAI